MEINNYYTKIKPSLKTFTQTTVIEASQQKKHNLVKSAAFNLLNFGTSFRAKFPWLFVIPLFALAIIEILVLKIALWGKSEDKLELHKHAIALAPKFSKQYPLWPYFTVSKSLELAFIEQELILMLTEQAQVVEVAIGEGSFSARIFPTSSQIVGLDINPVSLKKASELPHVSQAIVCDCLAPPLLPGSFDILLANNFLHHVSDKNGTLAKWSKLVSKVIFNESTPLWSLGWPVPFLLRKIGLKKVAQQVAETINQIGAQDLQPEPVVTEIVSKNFNILRKESYFSERTYFLANLFCLAGLNMVLPEEVKKILLNKHLRSLTIHLTTTLTRLLLSFDQYQDRSRDVLISYVGESKTPLSPVSPPSETYLTCPTCQSGALDTGYKCQHCGTKYNLIDNMLFLLPPELKQIEETYDPVAAAAFPDEHL